MKYKSSAYEQSGSFIIILIVYIFLVHWVSFATPEREFWLINSKWCFLTERNIILYMIFFLILIVMIWWDFCCSLPFMDRTCLNSILHSISCCFIITSQELTVFCTSLGVGNIGYFFIFFGILYQILVSFIYHLAYIQISLAQRNYLLYLHRILRVSSKHNLGVHRKKWMF